mmetsp:Transcript_63106/g.138219  ORF Transcript_63106/g.138219 Transcript_63106/m.138219 type:complete len:156 (-) Transcript_63106:7-474(-)
MEVARRASASANGKRLFVSGVAPGVMKTDLQREFGEFGHVTDIELPLTARGVAFVEFDSALDAADAQRDVTGRKLKGMVLKVKMADVQKMSRLDGNTSEKLREESKFQESAAKEARADREHRSRSRGPRRQPREPREPRRREDSRNRRRGSRSRR